jgi:hypothetical protein
MKFIGDRHCPQTLPDRGRTYVPILSVSPWLIWAVGSRVTEWLRRCTSPVTECPGS